MKRNREPSRAETHEDLYRRLMELTGDGVYRYAFEDGKILFANQGLVDILDLDCPPEMLVGKYLRDLLVYTEKEGTVRHALEKNGEIRGFEYHFKTLKGEDRWVLHDSLLATDKTTNQRIVEAIAKDITERKLAERKLAAEEDRLRVTLRSIGDAVIATDVAGKIVMMNAVAEQLTGWSQDSAMGLPLGEAFRIINEKTRRPCANPVEKVIQTGRIIGLANHTALISRDGAERSIADSGAPILDPSGKIIGVVLVFRDITGLKRSEEELRMHRLHLEELVKERTTELENLNRQLAAEIEERKVAEERDRLVREALEILNRSEEGRDAIREILTAIRQSTGFEAVGIRLHDGNDFPYYVTQGFPDSFVEAERHLCARDKNGNVIRDEGGDPILECMCGNILRGRTDPALPFFTAGGSFWSNCTTELLASTTEEQRKARTRNRCNSEGYESVALIPLKAGKDIIGLLQLNDSRRNRFTAEMIRFFEGFGSTIGIAMARRRANERLTDAVAELERSNKELEQFAYVASHDLQEPLRMVASFTQLLAERYDDKLDADGKEFIEFAVDGAHRMQGLINDLLTYSRVGRQGKPFALVSCESILDHCIGTLEMAIKESSAEVTHTKLPTVMGDDVQLAQLFQNLVGNAIKFHGAEPPRVHVSADRSDGEWIFQVRDNGIGIDPQYSDRIFVIFQRLHTRKEYPGTGIGLAICKKVVERHGGRIWMESEPGKGTTFLFSIPEQ